MTTIIVTQIYDEIIEYYSNTDFGAVIIEPTISDTNTSIQSDIDVSCDFLETDDAYRIYVSDDLIEDSNEKIRRYLTRHFSYLMKNVFYLDTKKYIAKGAKGTFFIYKRDYPIIKEILLRSVSQNEHDIIIGKWLNGKIKDNDYYEIVKLSERLFHVIRNIEENDSDITERWITALKLALRTDFAYTMIEVEFSVCEIFSYSLPFKIEQKSTVQFEEKSDFEVCHTYFSNSILNHLDTNDEKAQNTIYKIIYAYLDSVDFDKLLSDNSIPPIELLQFKSVCEFLYTHNYLMKEFPNINKVNDFIDYFISVDKDYRKRLVKRKQYDKRRYQLKK